MVEVYDRISSHHPDLDTENMSAELQDLIARMLVKDPLSRISLAQVRPLEQALDIILHNA